MQYTWSCIVYILVEMYEECIMYITVQSMLNNIFKGQQIHIAQVMHIVRVLLWKLCIAYKSRLQIFSGENEGHKLDFTLETIVGTVVTALSKNY